MFSNRRCLISVTPYRVSSIQVDISLGLLSLLKPCWSKLFTLLLFEHWITLSKSSLIQCENLFTKVKLHNYFLDFQAIWSREQSMNIATTQLFYRLPSFSYVNKFK